MDAIIKDKISIVLIVGAFVVILIAVSIFSEKDQRRTSNFTSPADNPQETAMTAAWKKTPAGQLCAKHLTWQKEECDELIANHIWIGMGYDMLVYLRGQPDHANVSNYGDGSRYQYCWNDYTPSCFYDKNNDGRLDAYN